MVHRARWNRDEILAEWVRPKRGDLFRFSVSCVPPHSFLTAMNDE